MATPKSVTLKLSASDATLVTRALFVLAKIERKEAPTTSIRHLVLGNVHKVEDVDRLASYLDTVIKAG